MDSGRYRDIVEWFFNGNVGASSKVILAHMIGMKWKKESRLYHPADTSDFNRCLELLKRFPEFRPRLHELSCVSPYWSTLVSHWNEIESLMSRDRNAAFFKMRKIYDAVRNNKDEIVEQIQ